MSPTPEDFAWSLLAATKRVQACEEAVAVAKRLRSDADRAVQSTSGELAKAERLLVEIRFMLEGGEPMDPATRTFVQNRGVGQ